MACIIDGIHWGTHPNCPPAAGGLNGAFEFSCAGLVGPGGDVGVEEMGVDIEGVEASIVGLDEGGRAAICVDRRC